MLVPIPKAKLVLVYNDRVDTSVYADEGDADFVYRTANGTVFKGLYHRDANRDYYLVAGESNLGLLV